METATKPTDAQIWDACAEVMQRRPGALELCDVAPPCGMTEGEVISALIRETGVRRQPVEFRFPALPRAAITRISFPHIP